MVEDENKEEKKEEGEEEEGSKKTPTKSIGIINLMRALMTPLHHTEISIFLNGLSERGVYRYVETMIKAGLQLFGFYQPRMVPNEATGQEEKKQLYTYSLLPESCADKSIDNISIYRNSGDEEGPVELCFSLYDPTSGEETSEIVVVENFSILLFGVIATEEEESADETDDER